MQAGWNRDRVGDVSNTPFHPCIAFSQEQSQNEGELFELSPPLKHSYDTAVLFADVSGYTAMCEAMANSGPGGDEHLAKNLNSYFELMVKSMTSQGEARGVSTCSNTTVGAGNVHNLHAHGTLILNAQLLPSNAIQGAMFLNSLVTR